MEFYYLERKPEKINSETTILFMLHGYGSNEEDLFSFLPDLPKEMWIVSFRAPKEIPFGGYSWFDLNLNNLQNIMDEHEVSGVLRDLMQFITRFQRENNIQNRMDLIGFSQGGILSYALALSYPEYFHKISILSAFPEKKILNQISKNSEELKRLTFFISHGMEDGVIPLEWAREAAPLLEEHKIKFTFREYMSGHGVNQKNYLDLMSFLNNDLMLK